MKEDMLKESLECTSLLIHVQLSSQQFPYYYSTFEEEENESEVSDRKKVIVLGSDQTELVKVSSLITAVFTGSLRLNVVTKPS